MRSDKELLNWLIRKVGDRKVHLEGVGWIDLTRESINDEMDEEVKERSDG